MVEDEGLRDLPNINLRRRSLKTPKICPKCLGPIRAKESTLGGWLLPPEYICPRCGYRGMVALERPRKEDSE